MLAYKYLNSILFALYVDICYGIWEKTMFFTTMSLCDDIDM